MVDVPSGFQPAGRAPAPPPLDLVQDFVNTEIPVWARGRHRTPEQLESGSGRARFSPRRRSSMRSAFVAARALRRVLRRSRTNAHGSSPRRSCEQRSHDRRRGALRFDLGERATATRPAGDGVSGALAEIMSRVFDAQASGAWSRLKSCPGPHCGWLFYDASRNASSTWCSMSICGNRTKTAAYRRRRAEP